MLDRVKNVFDVCFRADIDAALADGGSSGGKTGGQ
jgi:hypothetical protein